MVDDYYYYYYEYLNSVFDVINELYYGNTAIDQW